MSVLTRLRSLLPKRATPGIPTPSGEASTMLAGIAPSTHFAPPDKGVHGLMQAYSSQPWLYAVTDKVATAVAAQPWKLYVATAKGNGKQIIHNRALQKAPYAERKRMLTKLAAEDGLREIETHPLLDALDAPNSIYMSGQQRRLMTSTYLDLTGECFLLKERNGAGMPINFWLIPPTWIMALPTPTRQSYRVSFIGWQGEIPQSEFLRLNKPNPINPYARGTSLARALGDEIETYEYASKHSKQVFFNQARPDLVVAGKSVTKENIERLERRWYEKLAGFWNVAKPFFLAGEMSVTSLPHNFQHLELSQLRQSERDTIIATYGIPPELFGIHDKSNRATIAEASYIMSRYVTMPRLELLRGYYQNDLVPEYDERLIIDYVSPIEDDKEFHLKAIQQAPWLLDVEQQRALLNLPDNGDGKGVYVLSSLTTVRTLNPADNATAAPSTHQEGNNQ